LESAHRELSGDYIAGWVDGKYEFSIWGLPGSTAQGAVLGTLLGPLAKVSPAVVTALEAFQVYQGLQEFAHGNYWSAAFDFVSLALFRLGEWAMQKACFVAGTKLMARGPWGEGWREIERITTDDEVLSRDENDPFGPLVWKKVEETFERWGFVHDLEVGEPGPVSARRIGTTLEHPFYADGKGWTPAGELAVGDRIPGFDPRESVTVRGVSGTSRYEKVYNLRVAEYHTYFVGDADWAFAVWAHNAYQTHHIATNKSIKSGWTAKFQRVFAKAGMTLEHKANKFLMLGHKGRHARAYHRHVLERLTKATDGLTGRSYKAALLWELRALKRDLIKFPEMLKGINLPPI
jgi:hypothetical protein